MLWLTPELSRKIVACAQEQYPLEACGLLIGDENGQVVDVVAAANVSEHPETTYRIDELVLAGYIQDVVGFYHSHPNGKAIPSSSDIHESCYPDHIYLIVGLNKGHDTDLAAWKIGEQRVKRIPVYISNVPTRQDPLRAMTGTQNVLVGISLFLGLLIVIVVSLSLLPPAPPIP